MGLSKSMFTGDDKQKGLTLIELMVATLVFVTAVGVLMSILARNEEARETSYYVLESRQSARSALEFMVSEIRMAGSGFIASVVTSDAAGDSVILHPVNPELVGGNPEKITVLGKFTDLETTLDAPMPGASTAIKVASLNGFEVGDLVVVRSGMAANLFEVTGISYSTGQLLHDLTSPYNWPGGHRPWPPGGYDSGSQVFKANLVTYYVDRSDASRTVVMRQDGSQPPRVIGDHIDLLEMQYELQDKTAVAMPVDPSLIRQVTVTIEASSDEPSKRHVTRLVSAAKPRCL
ncbi:MAG: prepilin-type N-terminal cleavage/methylation domain-containing protein [Candidatus Eisenbacteria bacterium]